MESNEPAGVTLKGRTGLRRLLNATRYSAAGLQAAFSHEAAFRQELLIACVLVPVAFIVPATGVGRALLIGSLLLVLIVEVMNSAIEATIDRISLEYHPLAGRAKDLGSAAVMLSLINVIVVWGLVLLG